MFDQFLRRQSLHWWDIFCAKVSHGHERSSKPGIVAAGAAKAQSATMSVILSCEASTVRSSWYSEKLRNDLEVLVFARKINVITDESFTEVYNVAQTSRQKTTVENKFVSKVAGRSKSGKEMELTNFRRVWR